MTRADIIKALGWLPPEDNPDPRSLLARIERVVAQAEAQEREACAKVAERSESANHCAAAIRARGQA